jgi:hypothetical protein
MGDEDRDEGITRTEFDELRTGLSELADAFRELREASTPQERRRAQGEVDDAEEDLDKTARRLGVSRAKLEESIAAARKAERKEELREPLRELLEELKADGADDDGDDDDDPPAAKKKPTAKKPTAKKPPASSSDGDDDDPPNVDDPPVREHWSERGIGGMIR